MLYLEKKYIDEIVSHALSEAPHECCGILAGKNEKAVKLFRTTNSERSPVRYSVEPRELINIYQEIDSNGWKLLGIYHSHPHSEAYPSAVDIKYAYFPQSFYIIISLNFPSQPVVRVFTIVEGKTVEQELRIIN